MSGFMKDVGNPQVVPEIVVKNIILHKKGKNSTKE